MSGFFAIASATTSASVVRAGGWAIADAETKIETVTPRITRISTSTNASATRDQAALRTHEYVLLKVGGEVDR
jgi:hypothetical protein